MNYEEDSRFYHIIFNDDGTIDLRYRNTDVMFSDNKVIWYHSSWDV